eukprot:COSAG04_NODE_11794_length_688_cov_1.033956_2_plen_57_part_01
MTNSTAVQPSVCLVYNHEGWSCGVRVHVGVLCGCAVGRIRFGLFECKFSSGRGCRPS